MEIVNTIGRRKTSVARIYLSSGKGEILINNRDYKEYFPSEILQTIINQPFTVLSENGKTNSFFYVNDRYKHEFVMKCQFCHFK